MTNKQVEVQDLYGANNRVHCIVCDDVFEETPQHFIHSCPSCGNDDPYQTVYLQPEEAA